MVKDGDLTEFDGLQFVFNHCIGQASFDSMNILVNNHALGLSCIGAPHSCVELKCSILKYKVSSSSVYLQLASNCTAQLFGRELRCPGISL